MNCITYRKSQGFNLKFLVMTLTKRKFKKIEMNNSYLKCSEIPILYAKLLSKLSSILFYL